MPLLDTVGWNDSAIVLKHAAEGGATGIPARIYRQLSSPRLGPYLLG